MAKAEPIPLEIPPGIVKTESPVSQEGRYIDGDHVRFAEGRPEKIGGWERVTTSAVAGIPRGAHSWLDLNTLPWVALGTNEKLYQIDTGYAPTNITPLSSTGTLNNPFSTTNGSAVVTVSHTSHGRANGDTVIFSGASAVGGITVSGTYVVTGIPTANTYQITHSSAATSTAGPGGGASVSYQYEIPVGLSNGTLGLGWGVGGWGSSTWGTPRPSSPFIFEPRVWTLDNFGALLIANPLGGGIYSWDPASPSTRAAAVTNAPTQSRFVFVTGERFITSLGADGDPLLIRWASQNTTTTWTPAANNTANSRRVQAGSKLMGGRRLTNGANLIWTDTAVYLHQYTGSRFVYDTRIIGENAGLIGPQAAVTVSGVCYWMSPAAFYMSGGGAPVRLPRQDDIRDWVYDNITELQQFKCVASYVEDHNEVWWFYPSDAQVEPCRYVAVNLSDYSWTIGTMCRTAFTRVPSGGARPLLASTDGHLYEHEIGVDDNGAPLRAYLKYAPFNMGEGGVNMELLAYEPDMERQTGTITLTATTWDRIRDATPYTDTVTFTPTDGLVDLRSDGRLAGFEIEQNVLGGDFRFGKPKMLVKPKGSRR